MIVQLIAVADYASVSQGDKLNVMGVFDTIQTRSFPTVHPSLVLVLRLRFSFEDGSREHEITVTLENEDGKRLFKVDGKVGVGTIPAGEFRHHNQIFQLNSVMFPVAGAYVFRVRSAGAVLAEAPLRVCHATGA